MALNVFEPPFIYFIIMGIVFGIGLAIFKRRQTSSKQEGFQSQSLNEVIQEENLKPYLSNFGRNIKKGKLVKDFNVINVKKVVKANFKYAEKGKDNKIEHKETEFYIFQSGKSTFDKIPILNKISGKKEFYVVSADERYIIKDSFRDIWIIKEGVFFYQLGGVWVSSEEGREFISELVYKKIYENLKEEDMNYPKRIVWYNDKYAFNMTDKEKDFELEKKKWEDRVSRETGVKKGGG